MAGKKLPKDVDFAAGFFSQPAVAEDDSAAAVVEKITAPKKLTNKSSIVSIKPISKYPSIIIILLSV